LIGSDYLVNIMRPLIGPDYLVSIYWDLWLNNLDQSNVWHIDFNQRK
jgi:hypothetical protein